MNLKINFLVRPSKASKSGLCSIECSITIDGKRFNFAATNSSLCSLVNVSATLE